MKTKEEVIKEAWGDIYSNIKDDIDENGWFHRDNHPSQNPFTGFKLPLLHFAGQLMVRPVELQGIENNNGWKSVYGDMPPENSGLYFVYDGKDVGIARMSILQFRTLNSNEVYSEVTHYQPIFKPKPPIY